MKNLILISSLFRQETVVVIHRPLKLTADLAAVSASVELSEFRAIVVCAVLMDVIYMSSLCDKRKTSNSYFLKVIMVIVPVCVCDLIQLLFTEQ